MIRDCDVTERVEIGLASTATGFCWACRHEGGDWQYLEGTFNRDSWGRALLAMSAALRIAGKTEPQAAPRTVRVGSLAPGTLFDWEGVRGQLVHATECRAYVKLFGGEKEVSIGERTFKARGSRFDNWTPSVEVTIDPDP